MKLEYVRVGRMMIVNILGAPRLIGVSRLRRGDHFDLALGLGVGLVKAGLELRGSDKQAFMRMTMNAIGTRGRLEMPEALMTNLMLKQIEYRMVRAQEIREDRNGDTFRRAITTLAPSVPGPAAKAAERLGRELILEWQENHKWTSLVSADNPKTKTKVKRKSSAIHR